MEPVDQFEAQRADLFALAYRMLGSVADAEDVLQEAYLRYRSADTTEIRSPKAFLTTVVTRLCLSQMTSARARRETYVGPWLPEPLLTGEPDAASPARRQDLLESISLAFLVLLEQLTPAERAVFLLHEVFELSYREIGEILDRDAAACRQLGSRAARHIAAGRPRFSPSADQHRAVLTRFMEAVGTGSYDGLVTLLREDATLVADAGGKVPGAATQPLHGREPVARFVLASTRFLPDGARPEIVQVNGAPAAVVRAGGTPFFVLALDVVDQRVSAVRVFANPDKLRGLA